MGRNAGKIKARKKHSGGMKNARRARSGREDQCAERTPFGMLLHGLSGLNATRAFGAKDGRVTVGAETEGETKK